ncbi:hypothetical protein VTJ04DRAFT_7188 [Mycothermus thermophilus]|uniref:uncharacterized protein n=1 Tax=Humicola insolens TaxID=85995 RepID=UPI0037439A06
MARDATPYPGHEEGQDEPNWLNETAYWRTKKFNDGWQKHVLAQPESRESLAAAGAAELTDPIPEWTGRQAKKNLDEGTINSILHNRAVTLYEAYGDDQLYEEDDEDPTATRFRAQRDAALSLLYDLMNHHNSTLLLLEALTTRVRDLEKQREDLEAANEEAATLQAALESETDLLQSRIKECRDEVTGLNKQLAEKTTQLANTQNERAIALGERANALTEKIATLEALQQKNTRIQELERQAEVLRRQIEQLNIRLATASNSTDRSIETTTPIPSVETTTDSEKKAYGKTAKIPDPDKFSGSDTLKYTTWKAMVMRKLEGNPELFPNEATKFGYVTALITGDAADHLNPLLSLSPDDEGAVCDLDSLFDFLEANYTDPTDEDRAANEYDALKMKPGEQFRDFHRKFLQLVIRAKIDRSRWKREFHKKLTPGLRKTLVPAVTDTDVDFHEYQRLAQQYALELEEIRDDYDKSRAKNKAKASGGGSSSNPSGSTTKSSAGGSGTPRSVTRSVTPGGRLTPGEKQRFMDEGRCFSCGQTGHTKSACPKAVAATIQMLTQANETAETVGEDKPQSEN